MHARMGQARRDFIKDCFQVLKLIVSGLGFSIPPIAGTCLQASSCVVESSLQQLIKCRMLFKTSDSLCIWLQRLPVRHSKEIFCHPIWSNSQWKRPRGCPPLSQFMNIFNKLTLKPPSSKIHCASYIKRNPCVQRWDGLELGKTGFPSVRTQLLVFPNRHP